MTARRLLAAGCAALCVLGLAPPALAISRDEVMVRAKAFAYHPWTCTNANLTAPCKGGYKSAYVPGDYLGLPYDWGGYMTLFEFDQQIAKGYGAGSYPQDGVLECTAGVDCSGYVSKCWDAAHYGTASLGQISSAIDVSALLAGDALNKPDYHVVLFSHKTGGGEPVFYEAVGYNVHVNVSAGWSYVAGYTPRRYQGITGSSAGNPAGTPLNPIVIGALPYTDQRDTTESASDVLDGCGAAPSKQESGPEYVYQLDVKQPGTLTAAIQDDVNVDIDVHLYTSMNTGDCVARDDSKLSYPVDCGTYYIVADTFHSGSSGKDYPGPYSLTVTLAPSGKSCGGGPPQYAFEGELGDPCAYPGDESLPFCNPNLGADTCLYGDATSFCSKPCDSDGDCKGLAGGCCGDIGQNELYCLTAELCGSGPPDGGSSSSSTSSSGSSSSTSSTTSSGSTSTGSSSGGGAGGGVAPGGGGPGTGGEASSTSGSSAGGKKRGADSEDEGGCALAPGRGRGGGAMLWLLAALVALARGRKAAGDRLRAWIGVGFPGHPLPDFEKLRNWPDISSYSREAARGARLDHRGQAGRDEYRLRELSEKRHLRSWDGHSPEGV